MISVYGIVVHLIFLTQITHTKLHLLQDKFILQKIKKVFVVLTVLEESVKPSLNKLINDYKNDFNIYIYIYCSINK